MKISFSSKEIILIFVLIFVASGLLLLSFFPARSNSSTLATNSAGGAQKVTFSNFSSKYLEFRYPNSFKVEQTPPTTDGVVEVTNLYQKTCSNLSLVVRERCLRREQINILIQNQTTTIEDYNNNFYDGWENGVTFFGDCINFKGKEEATTFLGRKAVENDFLLSSKEIQDSKCTNLNNWDLGKDYTVRSYVFANNNLIYTIRYVANNQDFLDTVATLVTKINLK